MDYAEISGERLLVPAAEWLRVIQQEYLADYIQSGGSAVKVISGTNERLQDVRCRLQEMAAQEGYFAASLDPMEVDAAGKKPDLHRIDKFYFATTRHVDWTGWAALQARAFLRARGFVLAEGQSLSDLEAIAAANGRDPQDLLLEYQREFATPQIRDHQMTLAFRSAVTALGRAQLLPDAVTPTTEEVLLAWFAGRTMPGAATALKKIQIFERINQTNARHILASFCHWLPKTGHKGLVVVLDFRPYEHKRVTPFQKQAEERAQNRRLREAIAAGASAQELNALAAEPEAEPAITYSDAAYMQMLTLIRRFIDEVDWFERFLLVILTTPRFYEPKSLQGKGTRSYFDYDALQTRIGLEVHDARRANPYAALVHLRDDR